MRNISYHGHARERKRGFDPIQVPDQTQKYAQEAERTLQHMREYQEQDLRNRTAVLDGLKENARIEENVRESNEDFRKTFDEAYQKAELQHYEQRLKDVQPGGGLYQDSKNKIDRIKKQQEDWKKLADLLPKAAKAYGQIDEERGKKLTLAGADVATKWNLVGRELAAIKNGDRQIGWVDAGFKSVEAKLENASAEERRVVFGLSGRKMLGAQGYALSVLGKSGWATFKAKNSQNSDIAPGIGSLYSHESGHEGTNLSSGRVLMKELRRKFIEQHLGYETEDGKWELSYNPEFIRAHLTPHLNAADEKWYAEQNERDTNKFNAEAREEQETAFKYYLKGYAGEERGSAVQKWMDQETGNGKLPNRTLKKAQAFDIMARLAASGEMSRAEFADIANSNIVLGDAKKGGKPQRLGTVWADNAAIVYKAFDQRDQLWEEKRTESRKVFDAQMKQEAAVALTSMGRNFTKHDISQLEDLYEANGYQPSQWVLKLKNATEQAVEDSEYTLDALVGADSLSMAELYSGKYHGSVLKKYEKLTTNGPGSISSESKKEYQGAIRNAITAKVNGILVDSKLANSQAKIQTGRALQILTDRVRYAQIGGKYENATEAWAEESNKLRKEIEKGEGIFAPVKRDGVELIGKEGGFADLKDPLEYDRIGIQYRKEASIDKEFIYKPESFRAEDIQSIKDIRTTGKIPNWVFQVAQAYPNKDETDVINAILATNGEKPIERRGVSRIKDYVHPAMQRLITRVGSSQAKTGRAIRGTQELIEGTPSDQAMLDLTKSKAVMEVDPKGGYDVISTSRGMSTSTANYKKPLSELTVNDVRELQRREGLKAGAYQIDLRTLLHYEGKGWIDPEETFTPELQDRIKRWELWRTSGEFEAIDANGSLVSIPGLGQNTNDWEALDPEKDQQIKLALAKNTNINAGQLKDIFGGLT